MQDSNGNGSEQIKNRTTEEKLQNRDKQPEAILKDYASAEPEVIEERITEIDNEWDIERAIQLQTATLALTGIVLGLLINKKWFALSILNLTLLAQHSIQGWSPSLPLFRKFGFRTRKEIDKERFALKAIRGDFRRTIHSPGKAWQSVQ